MNWKIVTIGLVALLSIGAGVTGLVTRQKEYKVEHKPAVPQTVGEDGRYQAGSDEQYWVDPPPALVWQLTKSKGFRLAAFIVVGLIALYLGLCAAGAVIYNHKVFFGGLVSAAAFWFAAYSSAFENNTKKLSPKQYEAVKGNIESLWTKDNYIR